MEANKIAGQVLKLVSLINYEEASVVSRTIIDKTSGNITLFAFEKGQ